MDEGLLLAELMEASKALLEDSPLCPCYLILLIHILALLSCTLLFFSSPFCLPVLDIEESLGAISISFCLG